MSSLGLYDEIQVIRERYPESLSAVMPALQLAQERNGGWLPEEAFREVADALDLTPAYCLSIASFYDMFRLEPVGEHLIEVCTNISCYLTGGKEILCHLKQKLGLENKGTTADGVFTLEEVECLAACGTAPALQVNDPHDPEWPIAYHENQTVASADALIERLRAKAGSNG